MVTESQSASDAKVVSIECVRVGEVVELLMGALRLRSSEVTERNPISSRSHAICTIEFVPVPSPTDAANELGSSASISEGPGEGPGTGPTLTLVDLAGSERNYETTQMTAAQHKESAQINLSLMALKNCFTAFHQQLNASSPSSPPTRIGFRASPLTRVLRRCFTSGPTHRTTVVATLSPSPIDLLHSINTLQHVVKMCPPLDLAFYQCTVEVPLLGVPLAHVPVSSWTADQVHAWLGSTDGGRFANLVLPPGLDGHGLMQLSDSSLAALFSGQLRRARQEGEGEAWVEEGDAEASAAYGAIGQALWRSLRREEATALLAKSSLTPPK